MENIPDLIRLLSKRVIALRQESVKLFRLANAASSDRARYTLREEARQVKRKAEMLQARIDKLIKLAPKGSDVLNG